MTPTDSGRKSFNATFSFGSSITTTPSLNSSKANSSFISTSSGNYQHQSPRKQTPRKPIVDKQSTDILQICMDVPYTDHPYLIGPRGRKAQYFMSKYQSLIHFPDSNCRPDGPKMNNVIITGSMKNAEEIRSQIRGRTPIRLSIRLDCFKDPGGIIDQLEQEISQHSLPIRVNYSQNSTNGILKTEWRNRGTLVKLCEQFVTPAEMNVDHHNVNAASELYIVGIVLHPLINPWNEELSYRLISMIRKETNCQIYYPPAEKFTNQPPSYFIKGNSIDGVIRSTQYLTGLAMFQISFHMPMKNSASLDYQKIMQWQREYLVHTTIEPIYNNNNNNNNNGFITHRVILRSFEFCINSIYAVRAELLGFKKSCQVDSYDFMSSIKFIIPSTVFSDARLCYPLFAVENERNFDWAKIPAEKFFQHYYGGPYTQFQNQINSIGHFDYDARLTNNLYMLMNLDPNSAKHPNVDAQPMNTSFYGQNGSQLQPVQHLQNGFDHGISTSNVPSHEQIVLPVLHVSNENMHLYENDENHQAFFAANQLMTYGNLYHPPPINDLWTFVSPTN